ncbi:MAG: hypothetical protein AB7O50_01225 [Pseudolabrys sp.]
MVSRTGTIRPSQFAAAALALLAVAWPAHAQDAPQAGTPEDIPLQNIPNVVVTPAPPPLSDDELALALNYDPLTLENAAARKRVRVPRASAPRAVWKADRNGDGSTRASVSKRLAPDWNIRAGADLTVPGEQATSYRPGGPLPGTGTADAQGGFWAAAAVPHVADVRLRVDPGLTQNKFGADLQRTVPIGEDYSVTVQNKVAVTETTSLALLSAGVAGEQIWDTERWLKVNIHTTGTTIGAGTVTSTVDGVTHHTLSADQRVYGPLHVTGSVTDPGRDTFSQSIGARLKLNW